MKPDVPEGVLGDVGLGFPAGPIPAAASGEGQEQEQRREGAWCVPSHRALLE